MNIYIYSLFQKSVGAEEAPQWLRVLRLLQTTQIQIPEVTY